MKTPSLKIALPFIVFGLVVLFATFGSFLTPHDYSTSSLLDRNQPPVFLGGGWDHPLGTDGLGRDLLERLVVGARVSLGLALVGTLIGAALGTFLGLLAARGNVVVDGVVTALIDFRACGTPTSKLGHQDNHGRRRWAALVLPRRRHSLARSTFPVDPSTVTI